jgi:Ca-activated chloride channel family protein
MTSRSLGDAWAHPALMLLALVPLALLAWVLLRHGRPALRVPSVGALRLPRSLRARTVAVPDVLMAAALAVLAFALARPRGGELLENVTTEGIDIVVALDASVSMLAEDMQDASGKRQNRLDSAKEVIARFVLARTADRIGLTTFDEASVPRCPPTLDHSVLLEFMNQVEVDPEASGTALGSGLASAVLRLRDSKAKSRVVVLVTDGRNNAGRFAPDDAAEIARLAGIKVYAIGVGTRGEAPLPLRDGFGRVEYRMIRADVDEETLQKIADTTGGKYYRAVDRSQLEGIFAEIDSLEKSEIEVERRVRWKERYPPLARAALVLAVLAVASRALPWRTWP